MSFHVVWSVPAAIILTIIHILKNGINFLLSTLKQDQGLRTFTAHTYSELTGVHPSRVKTPVSAEGRETSIKMIVKMH